eukprot:167606-Rhodomonas_salina.2
MGVKNEREVARCPCMVLYQEEEIPKPGTKVKRVERIDTGQNEEKSTVTMPSVAHRAGHKTRKACHTATPLPRQAFCDQMGLSRSSASTDPSMSLKRCHIRAGRREMV